MTKQTQAKKKPAAKTSIAIKKKIKKVKTKAKAAVSKKKNSVASSKISVIVTTLRALNIKPLSVSQISKGCKISVPTINSCLSELANKKLVKSELDKNKEGRGRPSRLFYLTNAGEEEARKIA